MTTLQQELDALTGVRRIVEFEKAKGLPVYNAIFDDDVLWPVYRQGRSYSWKVQCHGHGHGFVYVERMQTKQRVGKPEFGKTLDETCPIVKTYTWGPSLMWWLGSHGWGITLGPQTFPTVNDALIHGIEAFRVWLDAEDREAFWRESNFPSHSAQRSEAYWDGINDTFRNTLGIERGGLPKRPDNWFD